MCTYKQCEKLLRKLLGRQPTGLEMRVNWGLWTNNPQAYETILDRVNKNKNVKTQGKQ